MESKINFCITIDLEIELLLISLFHKITMFRLFCRANQTACFLSRPHLLTLPTSIYYGCWWGLKVSRTAGWRQHTHCQPHPDSLSPWSCSFVWSIQLSFLCPFIIEVDTDKIFLLPPRRSNFNRWKILLSNCYKKFSVSKPMSSVLVKFTCLRLDYPSKTCKHIRVLSVFIYDLYLSHCPS